MDGHRDPPPLLRHTTTAQILRHTSSLFYSHLLTFVFHSSLLLTFRSNVQSASYYLSSLIDSDPSLKSLLSRLDFSASSHLHHRHHPRSAAAAVPSSTSPALEPSTTTSSPAIPISIARYSTLPRGSTSPISPPSSSPIRKTSRDAPLLGY